jgi:beta-galactosidase beta subunit
MIADTFEQRHRYTGLSLRFAAAFEFLEKLPASKPDGRYDIDGDILFPTAVSSACW